jgi:membrane protein implicated in regulation of membrane protease activity
METRQLIAYGIIAAIVLSLAAIYFVKRFYSSERTARRRDRRERAEYNKRWPS